MQGKLRNLLFIILPCALVVLVIYLRNHKTRNTQPTTQATSEKSASANLTPQMAPATNHLNETLYTALCAASTNLLSTKVHGGQSLADLRQALSEAKPNEASMAIRQFLDSKADAPTGEGFKINGNHFLDQSPTLRVYLLDYLQQIDPGAAAGFSRGLP